ncbi:hypothetical protein GUJ93_ZPchr0010g9739 [Zizania palustris]|uniref:Uncharacterized protein n=1 Tax=Zizania palustris TaxID=103762 RepID=A0A8J5WBQ7_ZIZPA|nr:hypothetical protein GUJ93_ZPchr0010g9739 [Zizania palustris]
MLSIGLTNQAIFVPLQIQGLTKVVMDGNKDEALRSIKLAETALASGDRQQAENFIRNAQRLEPSLPIDDMLATAKKFDTLNGAACQHKGRRGEACEILNLSKESVGPSKLCNSWSGKKLLCRGVWSLNLIIGNISLLFAGVIAQILGEHDG